jgi:7-keto-8-aminopelargonate synthetase-like enzyme/predicted N-acyltransferase
MAKINHNNYLDTIDELLTDAKKRGIIHLVNEDESLTGRHLTIGNKELLNFGTCGYLGLEMDQRLKDMCIDFTQRFGTQYSVSRTYVSSSINENLEDLLEQMYKKPVLVYSSTSSAHISVIPTLVQDGHAVILDQQVHMSVQTGAQLLRQKGIPIEMVRHSNIEMLERKILELGHKYKKIWYMIDGVYSMYGDVAPMDELLALMEKYEQLHLYIDDAHGMGWSGKHGTGFVFEKIGDNKKIILVTTLAKGFGCVGGVAIFPDDETLRRVKTFGGPLTYSHPLPPPILGAAIASAKIHLSPEIEVMQAELEERIKYCNKLLEESGLPVVSDPRTPIYFIAMGQPKVGYNMVKRMMNDGFYMNISLFPAVPVKNTGLRFTLTRHVKLEDIDALVKAMIRNFPKALAEEGSTINDVRKAFKLPLITVAEPLEMSPVDYNIAHYATIHDIEQTEWNAHFINSGSFDWNGMAFMEDTFKNNPKPEDNWDFHYYIIKDKHNKPILATFFTCGIYKDDMLAADSVSRQIEERRKTDPYYLTSKTLAMGSLLTVGQHLYLDKSNPGWEGAFELLLNSVSLLQEKLGASVIILRDFSPNDMELKNFMIEQGFVKIDMPNNNIIQNISWNTTDEFLASLSARNRRHVRYDVLKHEHMFDVEIKDKLTPEESRYFHQLYRNVKGMNIGVNYFEYPEKIVKCMSEHKQWEFLVLKIKPEFDPRPERLAVAIMLCYKAGENYSPMLIGMDYTYIHTHKIYKQILYQTLKRARKLGFTQVPFGVTADLEKHKIGATQVPMVAYVQAKDNFNFEVIESMAVVNEIV